MFKLFRRAYKYVVAKLTGSFNEKADPKVQLEQAIAESREQDQRLRQQAANVIATQKQAEIRLNTKMEELQKLNAQARQALLMAEDASKKGDAAGATRYTERGGDRRHPSRAGRKGHREPKGARDAVDPGIGSGEGGSAPELDAARAEDLREVQAPQPARAGQDAGGDEQGDGPAQPDVGRGRADVRGDQGQDRGSVRPRLRATSELNASSVDSSLLKIEQATQDAEAQSRLSQLRSELGLDTASTPVEAPKPAEG